MTVPEELMEILVCPDCHGDLEEREPDSLPLKGGGPGRGSPASDDLDSVLVCLACGLAYPVRDEIPIMLIEEAFRPEGDSP